MYRFDVGTTQTIHLAEPGILSPDEARLAVIAGPHIPYVRIVDLRTQNVREYLPPVNGDWRIAAWSPDMKYLTMVRLERELGELRFGNVYLLDVNSGDFSQFTHEGNIVTHSPTIAPNGELIAYFASTLVISRLDHGCEWTVPMADVYDFSWSPDSKKMFLIASDGAYLADLETLFGASFSSGEGCR